MRKQTTKIYGVLLSLILIAQFSCAASQQNELIRNRQLWRESGIKNYRMTVDLQKTGHATPNGKFIITVRGGIADSIKLANDPQTDISDSVIKFGKYDTIEDIFEYIEELDKKTPDWEKRDVECDSKLGYPKKVNLDVRRVHDEELFFQVLQFEILK